VVTMTDLPYLQSLEAQSSAAVKVVLVPLIRRPVSPAKFLKPSSEPRAGLLQGCSHGDLLATSWFNHTAGVDRAK
jgi:hypothetical protein